MSTYTDNTAPYISVVVAARNDDHGGNMLGRMQAFMDAWIGQSQRYNLRSEIIVVEWNPPAARPRLIESLKWPADTEPCRVRFVNVPGEVHRRLRNSDTIPMHQMIAKNAGIRRARGEFVLATNLDIIFSAELMQFFAERRLETRRMYRIDRNDVASAIPAGSTVDELLAFCRSNMLQVFACEGRFEFAPNGTWALDKEDIAARDAGISFGPGWHVFQEYDGEFFRWIGTEAELVLRRPPQAAPRLLMEVQPGPSAGDGPVVVEIVGPAGSVLASARVAGRSRLQLHIPDSISSAKHRIRVQGGGVPLTRDPRFLNLRVFGLRWEGSAWLEEPFRAHAAYGGTESRIHVRSIQPRQIQMVLNPGGGASLANLEVKISDPAGNVLSQLTAERMHPSQGGECLLTLDLGFEMREGASEGVDSGERETPAWRLEVMSTQPVPGWKSSFYAPSPHASQMRDPVYLHTNASGDFTLLSREDWFALRGYPEFPIWPLHLDALLCYSAHHAGLREVILREPLRIFHIQHLSGAGWTPEGESELDSRIASRGVNVIRYHDASEWIDRMRWLNAPIIFTRGNWGLADQALEETVVQHPGSNP